MAKEDKTKTQAQEPNASQEQPAVQYVMMRRTTDGDGPHPIHPDEVDNYIRGDWVVVADE